jgi:hypothetical protein
MSSRSVISLIAVIAIVSGKTYFKEDFSSADWEKRWVVPTDWKSKVNSFNYTTIIAY